LISITGANTGEHLINTHAQKFTVNRLARKKRHRRNFSKVHSITSVFSNLNVLPWVKSPSAANCNVKNKAASQSQLVKRALGFALFFLLITSFTPNIAFSEAEFSPEYIAYSGTTPTTGVIADDSGFIIPVNPQTGESDRSEMTDKITHTVQSGETLSVIAETYDLNTSTLMWENSLSKSSILKVGQELTIPPVDGVSHEVTSGQSIDKIASLYEIDKETIIKQNNLGSETLSAGESIFIPGGEQLAPPAPKPVVASSPSYRSTTVARTESVTRTAMESTSAAPAAGKFIIYPTRGKITQGYHSWHRAVDIADRGKPPVWAAAGGTVVKASSGTWGGGYGNHIIIDHGNGVQTLYAHLDYLTVGNGQYVNQGEVVGKMGNTGRVYGATGIHLHFEVRENGIKQVPSYYW
jgi:murein DD-endopeptidase MepM/ murein hydrolase activator NlpD